MKKKCSYPLVIGAALMLAPLGLTGVAHADDAPAGYVSKDDYDKLLKRLDKVESELNSIKNNNDQASKEHEQDMEDLAKQIQIAVSKAQENESGDTKFSIDGDAEIDFTSQRHAKSNFAAGFSPLLIWEFNKQILFEAALDMGLNPDGSTTVDLTYADISYIVNDYATLTAGLAPVPFGQYHSHFDPPWVNKLPDDPLVFSDDEVPDNGLGIFLSGAIPIKSATFNYALYVDNGPNLVTGGDGMGGPGTAGQLDFQNYQDLNNNKAVGGRLGFLPFPGLEFGYSAQWAKASPDTSPITTPNNVDALLQAVDLNFVRQVEPINGMIYLKAEWVWSSVDKATYYDPTPMTGFGPVTFDNNRNGGYATLSYRPTMVSNKFLQNTEYVVRYDMFDDGQTPGGMREQRVTLGIDYWFDPRVVFKLAYEFDDAKPGPGADALLGQIGVGF